MTHLAVDIVYIKKICKQTMLGGMTRSLSSMFL